MDGDLQKYRGIEGPTATNEDIVTPQTGDDVANGVPGQTPAAQPVAVEQQNESPMPGVKIDLEPSSISNAEQTKVLINTLNSISSLFLSRAFDYKRLLSLIVDAFVDGTVPDSSDSKKTITSFADSLLIEKPQTLKKTYEVAPYSLHSRSEEGEESLDKNIQIAYFVVFCFISLINKTDHFQENPPSSCGEEFIPLFESNLNRIHKEIPCITDDVKTFLESRSAHLKSTPSYQRFFSLIDSLPEIIIDDSPQKKDKTYKSSTPKTPPVEDNVCSAPIPTNSFRVVGVKRVRHEKSPIYGPDSSEMQAAEPENPQLSTNLNNTPSLDSLNTLASSVGISSDVVEAKTAFLVFLALYLFQQPGHNEHKKTSTAPHLASALTPLANNKPDLTDGIALPTQQDALTSLEKEPTPKFGLHIRQTVDSNSPGEKHVTVGSNENFTVINTVIEEAEDPNEMTFAEDPSVVDEIKVIVYLKGKPETLFADQTFEVPCTLHILDGGFFEFKTDSDEGLEDGREFFSE